MTREHCSIDFDRCSIEFFINWLECDGLLAIFPGGSIILKADNGERLITKAHHIG